MLKLMLHIEIFKCKSNNNYIKIFNINFYVISILRNDFRAFI